MSYEKQTFIDRIVDDSGTVTQEGTKLKAEHLQHIEDGISALDFEVQGLKQASEEAGQNVLVSGVDTCSKWNDNDALYTLTKENNSAVLTGNSSGDVGLAFPIGTVSNVRFLSLLFISINVECSAAYSLNAYISVDGTPYFIAQLNNGDNTLSADISSYEGCSTLKIIVALHNDGSDATMTVSSFKAWQGKDTEEDTAVTNVEKYIVAPDGARYVLQVSSDGSLVAAPVIPSKALYIGNSLLLGFGEFGMAASDAEHDYYHLVNEVILNQKTDYTAKRILGTAWEASTTEDSQNEYLNNTVLPQLSSDLEMVIVQLGDNVNTDEKKAVFADGSRNMLKFIRDQCPRARVAWVGEWYSTTEKQTQIETACEKTGCTFIDISDLATSENKSAVGNTYKMADGTVNEITDSGVASHPGDAGFVAIANRVLYAMGITDTGEYYKNEQLETPIIELVEV